MFGPGESSVIVECSAQTTCAVLHAIFTSLILFFILLTGFAYTTVLERRVLAFLQARIGPNRAGPYGLLQPVADGIKLIFKEDLTPAHAKKIVFWMAPVIKVVPALLVMAVVPFGPDITIPWFDGKWYHMAQGLADVNVGVLWILGITSIGIYGIALAGWSSNNKYAMLGGLRASAQMISYELSMSLAIIVPVLLAGSMSMGEIIEAQNEPPILGWFVFQNPMAALIMGLAVLAEVNRAPFDMPEAEQELTAGYHAEYSGMKFAMFYLAEYIGMIAMSGIAAAFYFGGYHFIWVDKAPLLGPVVFGFKVVALLVIMIWVRGTLPRIRYDRLMAFGWKVMIPLGLIAIIWSSFAVILKEEMSTAGYVGLIVAVWVVFLLTFDYWLRRVGRRPEPRQSASQIEVVSLSGGRGTSAVRALDRIFARAGRADSEKQGQEPQA
jgi:NADH-quinone oxidoreductase subunit H